MILPPRCISLFPYSSFALNLFLSVPWDASMITGDGGTRQLLMTDGWPLKKGSDVYSMNGLGEWLIETYEGRAKSTGSRLCNNKSTPHDFQFLFLMLFTTDIRMRKSRSCTINRWVVKGEARIVCNNEGGITCNVHVCASQEKYFLFHPLKQVKGAKSGMLAERPPPFSN